MEGQEKTGSGILQNGPNGPNPWPYLEALFIFKRLGLENKSVLMQCRACLPKVVECSAFASSTSNLKKHITVSCDSSLTHYSILTCEVNCDL
jgi:hypothetical protein